MKKGRELVAQAVVIAGVGIRCDVIDFKLSEVVDSALIFSS